MAAAIAPSNASGSAHTSKPSKRRTKKDSVSVNLVTPQQPPVDASAASNAASEEDSPFESPYVKQLQKNVRNVNKKLSAMAKVDTIIEENPDSSLEDLVAARKINQDQRAQALKKPSLQSSLSQLEEQIAAYKKVEEDFRQRLESEKQRLQELHEKELEDAKAMVQTQASSMSRTDLRQKLLVLSRFLRAAAARRQADDEDTDDSKAFEGVLLLLYGGDISAVDAAERLINGSQDKAPSTDGATVDVPYERVKELALENAPISEGEVAVNGAEHPQQAQQSASVQDVYSGTAGTDPTIANAGLTEAEDHHFASSNNHQPSSSPAEGPEQAGIDSAAANAAATEQWERSAPSTADAMMDSWVSVPRPTHETEASSNIPDLNATQNWADEIPPPSMPAQTASATSIPQDGFHEVHHGRGCRGRGGSGGADFRGGGRSRGGFRGGEGARGRAGYRGDRGRGRGGGRGGRGRDNSS